MPNYGRITSDRHCPHCGSQSFLGLYGPNMRNCNGCFSWLIDNAVGALPVAEDDGSEEVKD